MPGRMIWDEATGQLVPEPEEETGGGSFVPLEWDDASGGLVEARPKADGPAPAPTPQPHAEAEEQSLWDELVRGGKSYVEGASANFTDFDAEAREYPWAHAAGQATLGIGAGLATVLATPAAAPAWAAIAAQGAAGAGVGALSAQGRGAGMSETVSEAAQGAVAGGFGEMMGRGLGKMLGRGAGAVRTPRAQGPRSLTEADEWIINAHTPTAEEAARAGWGRAADDVPTWADVDELQVTRTDELLKPASLPPTADELAMGEEQARRALLRSEPPRTLRPTYEVRDPLDELVMRNPDLAAPGGLEEAAQGAPGRMPPGRPAPSARGPFRDLETGRMTAVRYEGQGPHPGVPMGPPPAPEFNLGFERARTSVPPPLDELRVPPAQLRQTPGVDPDAPMVADGRPLPRPRAEAPLPPWRGPAPPETFRDAALDLMPTLLRGSVTGAGHELRGYGESGYAYADAGTLSYTLQSVLSSGDTGLPPEDQARLTDAVMSGDVSRVAAQDYLLKQRFPAYARRIERTLRDLNEGE